MWVASTFFGLQIRSCALKEGCWRVYDRGSVSMLARMSAAAEGLIDASTTPPCQKEPATGPRGAWKMQLGFIGA